MKRRNGHWNCTYQSIFIVLIGTSALIAAWLHIFTANKVNLVIWQQQQALWNSVREFQLIRQNVSFLISSHENVRQNGTVLRTNSAVFQRSDIRLLISRVTNKIEGLESHLLQYLKYVSNGDLQLRDKFMAGLDSNHRAYTGKRLNESQCEISDRDRMLYPHCDAKMKWMNTMWNSHPCYAMHGVDGSNCSARQYLSEVEHFCPVLRNRRIVKSESQYLAPTLLNTRLESLFSKMNDDVENYEWMRARIRRMWKHWIDAGIHIQNEEYFKDNTRKRILVHLGLLTSQSGFNIAVSAGRGGPLGELVQWSDLVSSLHLIGHQLTITSQTATLKTFLSKDRSMLSPCPSRPDAKYVDLIFTDIIGLRQVRAVTGRGFYKYRCLLRILDSFGTEPAFNHYSYMKSNRKRKSVWGGHGLDPSQFMTLFPHTPDNSFLGFVVRPLEQTKLVNLTKSGALVYGKMAAMWRGAAPYLATLARHVTLHSTVSDQDGRHLPPYVVNHGVLTPDHFYHLLAHTKYFVGLGFPYEGPSPLEAVAHGAIFLNPRFSPPKSRDNTPFFAEKPTSRKLSSQHPYTEQSIGWPNVITLDMSNLTEVDHLVRSSLNRKVDGFVPYEFTERGFLERVVAYTERSRDLCGGVTDLAGVTDLWPPLSALSVWRGATNHSCVEVCREQGLICERSFFPHINSLDVFKSVGVWCDKTENVSFSPDIFFPGVAKTVSPESGIRCVLQSDALLFSCAGAPPVAVRRICPCRDFRREQTALCRQCL